ncbi:tRNA pseudouridine(55) synthase TruB [Fusobacterium sp.]|uniref:tRNA pseudouridine(55) synthase TruB n=1 Tax=Fusobacterium sp. TaxID=68766 RepID=UPI0026238A58|nr:tRNA pseudouridine(55) synthase TruB [Fusobacterium sp.]
MDGIINVNKPKGITSFDVIRKLRKILSMRKIGHTGTLDPLAEGVLLVCVGKATKLAQDIEAHSKEYIAGFELGYKTDTYDIEGVTVDKKENFSVTLEELSEVIKKFIGNIKQVPPMYSAIKINGQKLYDLARKGEVVEREARDIFIESIEVLEFDGKKGILKCKVSKGTYIRSLIYDIGEELNTFAVMTSLVRTQVGEENICKSFSLEDIENLKQKDDLSFITSIEDYFVCPKINISGEKNHTLFLNGNTLIFDGNDGMYKVYYENKFLGLATLKNNRLKGYKYY